MKSAYPSSSRSSSKIAKYRSAPSTPASCVMNARRSTSNPSLSSKVSSTSKKTISSSVIVVRIERPSQWDREPTDHHDGGHEHGVRERKDRVEEQVTHEEHHLRDRRREEDEPGDREPVRDPQQH